MTSYEFTTIWRIDSPLEKVWNEIYHTEYWPDWWKGVIAVEESRKGDDLGVGSIRKYIWKTKLPYKLIFEIETVKVEPMTYLEGIAKGELDGKGIWRLSENGNETIARYDWLVNTTKIWMNILAPLAKPVFEWNHKIVMSWIQKEINLSPKPRGFHLVTSEVLEQLPELKDYKTGLAHIFICHTSASLTLNENADPDVRIDFESHFNKYVPENAPYYVHTLEGPDDMPAHIKASLLGSSISIPIKDGAFNVGIWQGIYLCEHRNHGGSRKIVVTINGEK